MRHQVLQGTLRKSLAKITRQLKVRRSHRGPTDPAVSPLPPDADVLVLVGELRAGGIVEIEALHSPRGGAEEVLGAAVRCKVVEVTRILGNLARWRNVMIALRKEIS